MDVCVCVCVREREREREICRGTEYNYACFLVFYNRWLDLSLGLRMRSTAVRVRFMHASTINFEVV